MTNLKDRLNTWFGFDETGYGIEQIDNFLKDVGSDLLSLPELQDEWDEANIRENPFADAIARNELRAQIRAAIKRYCKE